MSLQNQPADLSVVLQSLDPGAILDLFICDYTNIQGGSILYFHCGTNQLKENILWQGNRYEAYPVKIDGFAFTTQNALPRPKAVIANPLGYISGLLRQFNDLRGAKVIRKKVMAKYLDADNFHDGNPYANPVAGFEDEVFYVERKESEDNQFVVLELCSAADMEGEQVPARIIQANVCPWVYRSSECSYTGGACATWDDTTTANLGLDTCGKRLSSCKLRFPSTTLPFGGFPGAGRIQ